MKRNFRSFIPLNLTTFPGILNSYIPRMPSILKRIVERDGVRYEKLLDNTRYNGSKLREIRKSGQARECARRRARGCVQ